MKTRFSAVILTVLFLYMKITSSEPIPDPNPKPCFGFLLPLIGSIVKSLSFQGYGGSLGPGFIASPGYCGYYPGIYYGAPYYPVYPYYQYPYPYPYPYPYYPIQGPIIVNPPPVIVNPGRPILVANPPVIIGK